MNYIYDKNYVILCLCSIRLKDLTQYFTFHRGLYAFLTRIRRKDHLKFIWFYNSSEISSKPQKQEFMRTHTIDKATGTSMLRSCMWQKISLRCPETLTLATFALSCITWYCFGLNSYARSVQLETALCLHWVVRLCCHISWSLVPLEPWSPEETRTSYFACIYHNSRSETK